MMDSEKKILDILKDKEMYGYEIVIKLTRMDEYYQYVKIQEVIKWD